jgi:hypothetical protein
LPFASLSDAQEFKKSAMESVHLAGKAAFYGLYDEFLGRLQSPPGATRGIRGKGTHKERGQG